MMVGPYVRILQETLPMLQWPKPAKFAATASTYADPRARRDRFGEYMWTEHFGGVFVKEFVEKHASSYEKLMVRHAEDEMKHGTMFANHLGLELDAAANSAAADEERAVHAAYADWVKGDVFRMGCLLHGFELRSALIQCQWFRLLAAYPDDETEQIHRLLSEIARDEVFHVTYTMRIVCEQLAAGAPPDVFRMALLLSEADREAVARAARA